MVNKKSCTEAVYKTVLDIALANIKLWRRDSAWMNTLSVCQVVREISMALKKYQNTHQVILSMDACKSHMNRLVWLTAARMGFMMFGIPALTTGFLQPLDVYAIAQLKNKLRQDSQTSLHRHRCQLLHIGDVHCDLDGCCDCSIERKLLADIL